MPLGESVELDAQTRTREKNWWRFADGTWWLVSKILGPKFYMNRDRERSSWCSIDNIRSLVQYGQKKDWGTGGCI
jgi:hypothetical protein